MFLSLVYQHEVIKERQGGCELCVFCADNAHSTGKMGSSEVRAGSVLWKEEK